MDIKEKIKLIDKKLKKVTKILDITLINYESFNIHIRIDYYNKEKVCKLVWTDLDLIDKSNINISTEYIPTKTVDELCKIVEKEEKYEYIEKNKNSNIIFNLYLNEYYHYEFYKYIPKELNFLSEVFITIFNNLPKKLENFLYELHASIMNTREKYEYQETLQFDLFNDNLEQIFLSKIIKKGNEYYKKNNVLYLEYIQDKYYAIVKDTEKHLILVKYNEKNKELQLYCTCPCEFYCKHIYSVILAIRKKYENKFYKVLLKSNEETLLESSLNNKYYLCSGLEEDYIEIINKYGEIEHVPLLDEDNNLIFKVLEDKNNKLTKEIEKVVKKYKE